MAIYEYKSRFVPDWLRITSITDSRPKNYKTSNVPVVQYTADMEYIDTHSSLKVAERKTGISAKAIRNMLQGKYDTAGGYIWRKVN